VYEVAVVLRINGKCADYQIDEIYYCSFVVHLYCVVIFFSFLYNGINLQIYKKIIEYQHKIVGNSGWHENASFLCNEIFASAFKNELFPWACAAWEQGIK
jgi:hypothetical protein